MFRNVLGCSGMFHVPGFVDALDCEGKDNILKNLPPFSQLRDFLFKTLLSTLQYASVNHTLYGKCVMLPQLN